MIRDGTGNGFLASVNSNNQLEVQSESEEIQHTISFNNGQAYQAFCTTPLSNGTVICQHITNNDPNRNLVVTFVRHQIIGASGGTSFPNVGNYFRISFGTTYSSGGTESTPVNVNNGSGNLANVTVYGGNPTVTGTPVEIDRWYTKSDGDMNTFNKEGSVILQPGQSLEFAYVGDQTSGTMYSRVSFLMKERK